MTGMSLNCLPAGETLDDLARRNCAIGFDLRFCRSVAVSADERDTIICDPPEAELATLHVLTDLGEAIAMHDLDLTAPEPTRWLSSLARFLWPCSTRGAIRRLVNLRWE